MYCLVNDPNEIASFICEYEEICFIFLCYVDLLTLQALDMSFKTVIAKDNVGCATMLTRKT